MNILSIPVIIGSLSNFASLCKTVTYCDFNPTNPIIFERIITDFSENNFKVVEMKNSYAIYQVDNEGEFFVEGSFETNSPFYQYLDKELYYLGPGNYFINANGTLYNLLSKEIVNEELNQASYQINKNAFNAEEMFNTTLYNESTINKANISSPFNKYAGSYVDSRGFRVINNDYYFKTLNNFPSNTKGLCGIISLSIMLTYLDTFYNNDFIKDTALYEGKPLIQKTISDYYSSQTYIDFCDINLMPYPSDSLRDLLYSKEFNTKFPLYFGDQNPMLDMELKNTFLKYINVYAPHLKEDITLDSCIIFNVIGKVQEKINAGRPLIAVMLDYTTEDPNHSVKEKYHDPIVIGYKGSQLLCHAGRHNTSSPCIVFSTSTLYTCVSFEFYGAHKHSNNVTMEEAFIEKEVCGCGFTLAIC